MFGLRGMIQRIVAEETGYDRALANSRHRQVERDLQEVAARVIATEARVSRHAKGSLQLVDLIEALNIKVEALVKRPAADVEQLRTELRRKELAIVDLQDELAEERAQKAASTDEPTWTDHKGRVHLVREMPTPYIINCIALLEERGFCGRGPGSGIVNAFTRELDRRARTGCAGN